MKFLCLFAILSPCLANSYCYTSTSSSSKNFCVYGAPDTNGNLVFTVFSAATTWFGFGPGSSMSNSYVYVGWKNSIGGYTITGRTPTGHSYPSITAPGIIKVIPVAMAVPSWAILSFSFTIAQSSTGIQGNTGFIWGDKSSGSISNIDSTTSSFPQHTNYGFFSIDFTSNTPTGSPTPSNNPTGNGNTGSMTSLFPLPIGTVYTDIVFNHASVMILAWGFATPLGLIIARFTKTAFREWWVRSHVILLVGVTGVSTISGIIYISVYKPTPHFNTLHTMMGLVMGSVLVFQFVVGYVGYQLTSSSTVSSSFWTRLHRVIGRALVICSVFQVLTGFDQLSNLGNVPISLMLSYLIGLASLLVGYSFLEGRMGPYLELESKSKEDPAVTLELRFKTKHEIPSCFDSVRVNRYPCPNVALAVNSYCDTSNPPAFCVYGEGDGSGNLVFTVFSSATTWFGFGPGSQMAGSYVYVGWMNSAGGFTVTMRAPTGDAYPSNFGPATVTVIPVPSKITVPVWAVLKYSFQVNQASSGVGSTSNFIWAELSGGSITTKDSATSRFPQHSTFGTFGSVDFTVGGSASAGGGLPTGSSSVLPIPVGLKYKDIVFNHGVLMILAWGFAAPLGIIVARFMKPILGVWWYRIHVFLMFWVAGGCTFSSIIYIGLYKPAPHFQSLHTFLGLFFCMLLMVQFGLGYMSDRLFSPERHGIPWWDKLHWYFGRVIITLSFFQMLLGFDVLNGLASIPTSLSASYIVGLVTVLGAFLFLEAKMGVVHHVAGEFKAQ